MAQIVIKRFAHISISVLTGVNCVIISISVLTGVVCACISVLTGVKCVIKRFVSICFDWCEICF